MDEESKTPVELVAAFSRCVNFPRDLETIQIFAQELKSAANATGVSMEKIVAKCREVSDRAPEYSDMVNVGREIADDQTREQRIREASKSQRAEWEKQYGPPQKMEVDWDLAAIKERDRIMWAKIRGHLSGHCKDSAQRFDFSKASWAEVYRAKRELGYALNPFEEKIANQ
jgi:hypothetical protein